MVQQDNSVSTGRKFRRMQLQNVHGKSIADDNIGYQLLCKMDWKHGEGIGKNKAGSVDYIRVSRGSLLASSTAYQAGTDLESNNARFGGQGIGFTGKKEKLPEEATVSTAIFSQLLSNIHKKREEADSGTTSSNGFFFFHAASSSKTNSTKKSKVFIAQHKHTKLTKNKVGVQYSSEDLSGIFNAEQRAEMSNPPPASPQNEATKKRKRKDDHDSRKKKKKSQANQMTVSELSIGDYFRMRAMELKKIMY